VVDQIRQGFLGGNFDEVLDGFLVGVIGLSGGGSHVVQQLAHTGFKRFALFDPKQVEAKHLHRIVGMRYSDIAAATTKSEIARRTILGIRPDAEIVSLCSRWDEHRSVLRSCDAVIGCVDTFQARLDLEVECRRFLIPYLDIGMDVQRTSGAPKVLGQFALSMPGELCLRCLGVIASQELSKEAEGYGSAGAKEQVVFANGLLASVAVGVLLQLTSEWKSQVGPPLVRRFDGNSMRLVECGLASHLARMTCRHFLGHNAVGDARPVATL
jgi:molybdopterin/thiamine biosynthesis adenylyltransferase